MGLSFLAAGVSPIPLSIPDRLGAEPDRVQQNVEFNILFVLSSREWQQFKARYFYFWMNKSTSYRTILGDPHLSPRLNKPNSPGGALLRKAVRLPNLLISGRIVETKDGLIYAHLHGLRYHFSSCEILVG